MCAMRAAPSGLVGAPACRIRERFCACRVRSVFRTGQTVRFLRQPTDRAGHLHGATLRRSGASGPRVPDSRAFVRALGSSGFRGEGDRSHAQDAIDRTPAHACAVHGACSSDAHGNRRQPGHQVGSIADDRNFLNPAVPRVTSRVVCQGGGGG
jgi:hypothetical protein